MATHRILYKEHNKKTKMPGQRQAVCSVGKEGAADHRGRQATPDRGPLFPTRRCVTLLISTGGHGNKGCGSGRRIPGGLRWLLPPPFYVIIGKLFL